MSDGLTIVTYEELVLDTHNTHTRTKNCAALNYYGILVPKHSQVPTTVMDGQRDSIIGTVTGSFAKKEMRWIVEKSGH